jgi:type 1 glutamine amidotransferase
MAAALILLAAMLFASTAEAFDPITAHAPGTGRNSKFHDPSTILKEGDQYWLFSTGTGVLAFHSTNFQDWEPAAPVFENLPEWHQEIVPGHRGHLWAPDIIKIGNRYFLFYSVSSWGKNESAIGLATTTVLDPAHPDHRWEDQGVVIQSQKTDDFNAIDPAAFLDDDGRLWLAFGSFWTGIKLIELDPDSGKRIASDSQIHSLAHNDSIEAPCITKQGDDYYLFVNWGACCRGVNSTYEIRVGRSPNITGPYLDKNGKDLLEAGGTLVLSSEGDFIGPGHAAFLNDQDQLWLSCHFYDGARNGRAALHLRPMAWSDDGWPVPQALNPSPTPEDHQWETYRGKPGLPGSGKIIVFVTGDEEYRSEEAMPALAEILAERHGFTGHVLFATDPETGKRNPNIQNNIPGLHLLDQADLMVLFTRFRNLPDDQMIFIDRYLTSGKPIMGLRTATHAFAYPQSSTSSYKHYSWNSSEWPGGFGRQVLGETWVDHHGIHGKESTRGIINPAAKNHPILRGVGQIWCPTDVYEVRDPSPEVLVYGQVLSGMTPSDPPVPGPKNDPMMPVAWTREYRHPSGATTQVFTSTMGAAVDLNDENLRRLLANAAFWLTGLTDQISDQANVDFVQPYHPSWFGFR